MRPALADLRKSWESRRFFLWGLLALALCYLAEASLLNQPLLAPSAHDAYTLQALHWRQGLVHLPAGYAYDWLELALYRGRYYVSFPPFPTVPMLLLTFLFGEGVPSMLVNALMYAGSYFVGYALARQGGHRDAQAASFALFWVLGCNLLYIALFGGVWNIAQGMGFLLTMLFFYLMRRETPGSMAAGLICLACAVGCRPFQVVYVPLGLWLLFRWLRGRGADVRRALLGMLPYLVIPALIALLYGAYNYIRFDNPLEFGHTYLAEFQEASDGQFSLAYIGRNLRNILRLPYYEGARLLFPDGYGFAFYLCNPLFLLFLFRLIGAIRGRRLDVSGVLLTAGLLLHFFLLLMHKSFGAWQFGTRYLVDLLPAAGAFVSREKAPIRFGEGALMIFGIVFNLYGTLMFFQL